jgi:hypothetical protein
MAAKQFCILGSNTVTALRAFKPFSTIALLTLHMAMRAPLFAGRQEVSHVDLAHFHFAIRPVKDMDLITMFRVNIYFRNF